jgi:4'-phosphopantetheinyl transferase
MSPLLDPTTLRCAADGVGQLWHASLECSAWADLLSLLSGDELRRSDRFFFERDARRYVVSHAVLRTVLGRLIGVSPEQVALRNEAGGRPVLGDSRAGLRFSLSRSGELVLFGVASRPMGVDLEWLAAPMDVEALAGTVFSERENEAFRWVRPESRRTVLLRSWTRKEAILKATGQGLSIPPQAAEVLLAPGDATRSCATIACLGARWLVHTVLPRPEYVGAVAFALPVAAAA